MAGLIVEPSILGGAVEAPPSKAHTHRALLAASLAGGASTITNPLICRDTKATMRCIRIYGAEITRLKGSNGGLEGLRIVGADPLEPPRNVIDCGGSASTLRFAAPILGNTPGIAVLTGDKSLRRRPMSHMIEALNRLGVPCYSAAGDGRPPIIVFGGGLKGGHIQIPGDLSSQFISGLLLASPLAEKPVTIRVSPPLESRPYILLTLSYLKRFGVEGFQVLGDMEGFTVSPGQAYKPGRVEVPGDYSSAAYILSAAAVTSSEVSVEGLARDFLQADMAILEILRDMNVTVHQGESSVKVSSEAQDMEGVEVDLRDSPDLAPIVAVLGCYAKGETVIYGTRRLRFKESDRVKAIASELRRAGASITVGEDRLTVKGSRLRGASYNPHGDHRIAMACTVAALGAEGRSLVSNPGCVSKSYPGFYMDLRRVGAKIYAS
ncbi:MAG: 3-phosphoshikimate 1-carboxyvinyltransferase [Candidatus Bathyarchaeia archaeon]